MVGPAASEEAPLNPHRVKAISLDVKDACDAADLPSECCAAISRWCEDMGATRFAELLDKTHFEALSATAGLKPLQAERLQAELKKRHEEEQSRSKRKRVEQEALDVAGAVRHKGGFHHGQPHGRPRRVIFIRHGESEANVDRHITQMVPDHYLHLTQKGREQAVDAGRRAKSLIGEETVKFLVSPYVRTRETMSGIWQAWGNDAPLAVRSDVRLREQEYGNFDSENMKELHKEKSSFGAFYFRFPNGESPADCFDRASSFLESLYRSWGDGNPFQNCVIVSHGLMILVTVMRFLGVPVEEFEELQALKNCEFVVLEREADSFYLKIAYTWAPGQDKDYQGLRRKTLERERPPVWSGDLAAPLLTSQPSRRSPALTPAANPPMATIPPTLSP